MAARHGLYRGVVAPAPAAPFDTPSALLRALRDTANSAVTQFNANLFSEATIARCESPLSIETVEGMDGVLLQPRCRSRQHGLDNVAVHVGKPEVSALETISQLLMIDAQEMQYGGV